LVVVVEVKMMQHISGTRNGVEWPKVGGTLLVSADEAASLVTQKLGVIVETRVVAPVESAVVSRGASKK
jgi:hypothetical protein